MGQKAAIYCRVSTSDQSCERQELDLRTYAERCGYDIVGVWSEVASGSKIERTQRKQVLALAQACEIDAILVTELTRWGRSTMDLVASLQDLNRFGVSLVAQKGLQFDLTTSQGKLIASMMSALAEFESDLLSERVHSGVAAAQARGVVFGRRQGQRVKSDRLTPKVLELVAAGHSYRQVGRLVNLSKNTVLDIVKRNRNRTQNP